MRPATIAIETRVLRPASPGFRELPLNSDRDLFFQGRVTTWQLTRQAAFASARCLSNNKISRFFSPPPRYPESRAVRSEAAPRDVRAGVGTASLAKLPQGARDTAVKPRTPWFRRGRG